MRNNVECKRCPCGAILSLRESCKRCADAARARLHASGLCDAERPRQPYDCGKHQGNAALYKKPPLGKKPEWLDLKLPKDAMRVDWQTREEWQRRFAVTPAPGVDVVHDEESYRANLEARRKAAAGGIEAARASGLFSGGVMDSVSTYLEQKRAQLGPALPAEKHGDRAADLRACGVARMGNALMEPAPTTGASDETLERMVSEGVRYSPPVGAEVPWSVAKADMQRRSEARYNHVMFRMRAPGGEYAWLDGRLVTNGGAPRPLSDWRESCYTEAERADPQRRWVRLA